MTITYNPSVNTDGLVFYVDAANPKSYSSGNTVWYNISKNPVNGTLTNVGYSSTNKGTLTFNGSSSTILFPNSTLLDNQNMTVLVWAKTNATTQNGFWFEKGSVNTQYSLFQEGGSIVWRHNLSGNLSSQYTTTVTYLDASSYFQVAGTYDSINKITYINGLARTTTAETRTVSVNATGIRVGSYVSGSYYYNGNISIVKVYNRALSSEEIYENFTSLRGRFGI